LTTCSGQKNTEKGIYRKKRKRKKKKKEKREANEKKNFSAAFHGTTEKAAVQQLLSAHSTG